VNRREFLKESSLLAFVSAHPLSGVTLAAQVMAERSEDHTPNTNWADPNLGARAIASSYVQDRPAGGWLPSVAGGVTPFFHAGAYSPDNVFGESIFNGWQADSEASGAWIQIDFGELRQVGELWLLTAPPPTDILGQDSYESTYSRVPLLMPPQTVQVGFSSGTTFTAQLRQGGFFQIVALPKLEQTTSVRITISKVWSKPGGKETGIGKVRIFSQRHSQNFEIATHSMYDVRDERPVQAATLNLINPGDAVLQSKLQVSCGGTLLTTVPLGPVPARASVHQDVWIPAPFESSAMEFEVIAQSSAFCCKRTLQVPSYHSYFDGGTFELGCTNHNDLGWLNTPEKTADFRSSELILPALDLMREYPEFMYVMESTVYLMEFLDRHPERREEMAARMRERRFGWGASYTQLLEVSAGPEKLVRQFYFGRGWLKKTFPGVDTHLYFQTDTAQMSLQMPQILARAGVKYCLLGRLPFGFYNWQSPDGSTVLTRGYRYGPSSTLLDPKDNTGWLRCSEERESYYASCQLPRMFIYDYTSDYLPPQPALIPYVRRQNKSMEEFATLWNAHFSGDKSHQIHPPKMGFTTPERFLDQFTENTLDIPTLYGDWPFSWAYFDEPSHREALLKGRQAHNDLLSAERLYAGLGLSGGFADYPAQVFHDAWKANIWPDHGWGGNQGDITDEEYAASYAKSKTLAEGILSGVAPKLTRSLPQASDAQMPIGVYNPLSWRRTDLVECDLNIPDHWSGWNLIDEKGKEIPCEFTEDSKNPGRFKAAFIAMEVPAVGYRCFYLQPAATKPASPSPLNSESIENAFFRLKFGLGGIESLYDKRQKWEVLRTDKFDGGEVLQFTAPGFSLNYDHEGVGMEDFDRTANHDFRFTSIVETPIRVTAVREAEFSSFTLREYFHLYKELDRVDIEVDILNWDGTKERELRIAFPINLDEARLSYEVPFGVVEIGKDNLDVSMLPSNVDSHFNPNYDGGASPIAYREAVNWIDASSPNYMDAGCLAASDITLHIFQDETDQPVSYAVLQHVLLSTRKSRAWHPETWTVQKGDHRYRMALLPHGGNWRLRYREAIGFNYRLVAFAGQEKAVGQEAPASITQSYLELEPKNLVLMAMKKCDDDNRVILRFYEAEGNRSIARVKLSLPVRQAWRASMIEEDEEVIQPRQDGSIELAVGPWEIVTLKVAV
jgi:alpha-mannosidase